jgi:valyl-tRNA synthetase
MDIAPSKKLPVLLQNASAEDVARATRHRTYLDRLAGLESLEILPAGATAPESATGLMGELKILVPMAGLIDAKAEIERLQKLVAKTQDELRKTQTKLANEKFVNFAPKMVVEQERDRQAEFERTLASLQTQLERVRRLL